MAVSNEKLIVAAMDLRGSAPEAWDSFVEAVRHFSASHALELVRASQDTVIKSQGYAQALSDLAVLLSNVERKFEALRAQQVGRKT